MFNCLQKAKILSFFLGTGLFVIGALPRPIEANNLPFLLGNNKQINASSWRLMTDEEEEQTWQYILNSPLGIAALNQLAIEGFVNPTCTRTFYLNQESGGFLSLMRVKCSQSGGTSIAVTYDEIRIIFSRFEDNIEDFKIERVSEQEGILGTPLPDKK